MASRSNMKSYHSWDPISNLWVNIELERLKYHYGPEDTVYGNITLEFITKKKKDLIPEQKFDVRIDLLFDGEFKCGSYWHTPGRDSRARFASWVSSKPLFSQVIPVYSGPLLSTESPLRYPFEINFPHYITRSNLIVVGGESQTLLPPSFHILDSKGELGCKNNGSSVAYTLKPRIVRHDIGQLPSKLDFLGLNIPYRPPRTPVSHVKHERFSMAPLVFQISTAPLLNTFLPGSFKKPVTIPDFTLTIDPIHYPYDIYPPCHLTFTLAASVSPPSVSPLVRVRITDVGLTMRLRLHLNGHGTIERDVQKIACIPVGGESQCVSEGEGWSRNFVSTTTTNMHMLPSLQHDGASVTYSMILDAMLEVEGKKKKLRAETGVRIWPAIESRGSGGANKVNTVTEKSGRFESEK